MYGHPPIVNSTLCRPPKLRAVLGPQMLLLRKNSVTALVIKNLPNDGLRTQKATQMIPRLAGLLLLTLTLQLHRLRDDPFRLWHPMLPVDIQLRTLSQICLRNSYPTKSRRMLFLLLGLHPPVLFTECLQQRRRSGFTSLQSQEWRRLKVYWLQ